MEKEIKVEEKKCTKCDKMKHSIVPQVLIGMLVFTFTAELDESQIKEIISFFTN